MGFIAANTAVAIEAAPISSEADMEIEESARHSVEAVRIQQPPSSLDANIDMLAAIAKI